jgi:CBS domain containing-hemolysin-like protein
MSILILIVFLTLSISGMCSLFEATLYSTRLSALEAARAHGKTRRGAQQFIRMKREIALPISAILILNTIANTAGASLVGMYAARVLGYSWVPAIAVALTLGILFLSELLPKIYGVTHWRRIWPLVVWPLTFIQKALYPAVYVSHAFSRMFGREAAPSTPTEAEIMAMIRMGGKSGELTPAELQLLDAVFHFDELVCRQVMVPRREIVLLDASMSLEECAAIARRTMHTRYPVTKGSPDEILGVLHIKDLIGRPQDETFVLTSVMRPTRHVPESMPISRLLREMQRTRQHMAVVVDEYGTTAGIVTLENILEEIVGAVQDEFDAETPEVVPQGRDRYVVQGSMALGRLSRELGLHLDAPNVDTLSGLLVANLGRLLEEKDVIELEGAVAEVLEVEDGRAIRVRLRVTRRDSSDRG